jgi:phytoene desaturase
MKKRKVLIIGGGIAGLSAGSYLVRNGYDTEIFEAHTRPGGVCTSWKRGDYIFDYCIHWLVGTSSGTGLISYGRNWGCWRMSMETNPYS